MKNIIMVVKRIVMSYLILYGFNLIAVNFNMVIPINIITVSTVTILGVPALIGLILLRLTLM